MVYEYVYVLRKTYGSGYTVHDISGTRSGYAEYDAFKGVLRIFMPGMGGYASIEEVHIGNSYFGLPDRFVLRIGPYRTAYIYPI